MKKHYEAQQKLTNAELKEVLLKNFETLLSYTNTGVENILCVDHYHYFLAKIKTSIHKLKLDTTELHHGQVLSHLQALSKKIPSSILPDNFDEALTNHQDLEHEILATKCHDTTVKAAKFYTQKLRENLSVLQTSSGKIHVWVNNIFQTISDIRRY